MLLVLRRLPGTTPRVAKCKTRAQSYMVDKPPITSQRTVSCHLEARASEEAGSLSVPCAAPSRPNREVLRPHFRSDRWHQLLVESDNHTHRRGHDDHDVITPRRLKHQNARALPTRHHSGPNSKKSPLGARRPTEDIEPTKVDLKLAEMMTCASCNHSKH